MRRLLGAALAAVPLLVATPLLTTSRASSALTVHEDATSFAVSDGRVGVSITKDPWQLSLVDGSGEALVTERSSLLPDQTTNQLTQVNADIDGEGHDRAYPGLPQVSTRPLAYLRGGSWRNVTAFGSARTTGHRVTITARTSDGGTARIALTLRGSVVDLSFTPDGAPSQAVAESWQHDPTEHFFGGGGRFVKPELTGLSVPLWVSHGVGADRYAFTNEIAVPYLSSTGGWAVADNRGARGELAVSVPERPGSVSAIFEDDTLDLTLYSGSLQSMLSSYTADTGRAPAPPEWAFRPMWWDDNRNTQAEIDADLAILRREGIPVGAYWIDNPFQRYQGDFAPSPERFPTFDTWLDGLHEQGIRLMTWVSPFYDGRSVTGQKSVKVTGLPEDNNDHTYYPVRGLSDHVDLTDAATYQAEVDAATALLARGVDGFKLDRGEEDLGDVARFADGTPNRLEHSRYVLAYDRAMRQACTNARPETGCLLLARGGVGGSSRYVGSWAGDTLSSSGPAGLTSAIHHLLSEAMSGQPIWGSDVGGYGGLSGNDWPSEVPVTNPGIGVIAPTAGTFVRWAQLGAVSPVFESPHHPSDYDGATVAAIRKAAVLHDRLAPYTHAAALKAERDGTPIAQPLPLAFPDDQDAVLVDDEYLFDGCLLAAPLHTGVDQAGPAARQVYLPAGTWTNVFTGLPAVGPLTLDVVSPLDQFPLFREAGCDIPMTVFGGLGSTLPLPAGVPAPAALPAVALGAAGLRSLSLRARRRRRAA